MKRPRHHLPALPLPEIPPWLVLGCPILVLLLALCSCATPAAGGAAGGVPVAAAATILRGAADDVEAWDLNADGVLDSTERNAVIASVVARFVLAIVAGR